MLIKEEVELFYFNIKVKTVIHHRHKRRAGLRNESERSGYERGEILLNSAGALCSAF